MRTGRHIFGHGRQVLYEEERQALGLRVQTLGKFPGKRRTGGSNRLYLRWRKRDRRWQGPVFFDGQVELRCLLQGRDAKFLVEHLHAFPVLVKGGGALTRPGIQLHKVAMGWLVQAIQRQPAPGMANGRREISQGAVAVHEALECAG